MMVSVNCIGHNRLNSHHVFSLMVVCSFLLVVSVRSKLLDHFAINPIKYAVPAFPPEDQQEMEKVKNAIVLVQRDCSIFDLFE